VKTAEPGDYVCLEMRAVGTGYVAARWTAIATRASLADETPVVGQCSRYWTRHIADPNGEVFVTAIYPRAERDAAMKASA
jgi:hypothetical protein